MYFIIQFRLQGHVTITPERGEHANDDVTVVVKRASIL